MSYLTLLLLLHIGGAIVGFGPLFGMAVMGPLAGRLGGPQALGIMKAMGKIQRGIVIPMAILQGITGVLLISAANWDADFAAHEWLWISILLYLAALSIGIFVLRPNLGGRLRRPREAVPEAPSSPVSSGSRRYSVRSTRP